MDLEILGWPPDGPKLRLDHERFSYAGKFVMTNTGKAVARVDDDLVAAASFNEDRTDEETLWIRYVTVDRDSRGEGIGPKLTAFVRERAVERGYSTVRIAVNNPFAYEALYRAGFRFTGETTGIAELVLEYDAASNSNSTAARSSDDSGGEAFDRSDAAYQDGLERFSERDLSAEEEAFLSDRLE